MPLWLWGAIAASALVCIAIWRTDRGLRALGEHPDGTLPDTTVAGLLAFGAWLSGSLVIAVLGLGIVASVVCVTALHVAIAVVLLPAVTRSGLVIRIGGLRRATLGLVAGVLLYMGVTALMAALDWAYRKAGVTTPEQDVVTVLRSASPLVRSVLLGCVVIGAPIAEEVFYRGTLLPALARHMGFRNANVLQAVVFGLMHVANPVMLPLAIPLAVLAVVFGLLYRRTGSLALVIVAHATFNAIQLFALAFSV